VHLLKQKNIEVLQLNNLHAKVIIGTGTAIVGSANLSTNGLTQEPDEDGGWEEAGTLLNDEQSLYDLEKWFQVLWNKSKEISSEDISKAQLLWLKNRSNRSQPGSDIALMKRDARFFKDRPVYLNIYSEYASEEAKDTYYAVKKSYEMLIPKGEPTLELNFFEDDICYPKDSWLISVYMGPRGAVRIESVFSPVPLLDKSFTSEDGDQGWVRMVVNVNDILGMQFDGESRGLLLEKIKRHKQKLLEIGEYHDWLVPLYELLALED